ncbi:MAG: hypothetical protein JO166_04575, partial [Deltaproteobacteria bacterium]|nr:hypothetical protein [Deltaproteobacteria bacterium]
MMEKLRCLWLVLLMGSAFSFAQIARHNFTFEDAANLHSATAVAISPEGKTILYSVRFGGAKGPDTTEWRLIATTGGESRQLKLPDKFEPAGFTRDGSALYGTFEIDKRPQLVTFPLGPPNSAAAAAATPTPLTSMPRGIRSVVISPDGLHYALLADSRLPDPLEEVHSVVEAEQAGLYVVGETGLNGQWWCPTLNNIADIAWSHDGSSLAVLSHTPKIGFHYVRSFIDICTASGARHVATIDNAAGGIGWINGDVELIFLSTTSAVLTPDHVWTVSAAGGAPLDRTPKLEGSAEGLSVDVQGKAWIKVARGVRSEIDSFENHSLATAYGWPDGTIGGGPVSPQIASAPEIKIFTVDDPQHTANVAVARGNTLEKITYEGDDQ